MKNNKRMIFNALIFILLIFITYFMIFKGENIGVIIKNIKYLDIKFIIIGLILMSFYYIFEAINIKRILKNLGSKISLLKATKFTFIGAFFSAITPASTGGQPLEIYYMSKEKIKVSHSTIALLMHLCGFQISAVLLGITFAIFNLNLLKGSLLVLFIVGTLFNCISLSLTLIGIFSKDLSKALIDIFINIMKFFRIKNIDNKIKKINDELKVYHESANFIKKEKITFIKTVIFALLQILCLHSIPYLVYKAFGFNSVSYIHFLALQSILHCTVSFLPLPGSVGVNESVFLKVYTSIFSASILTDALVISRGISFYIWVIVELFIVIINHLVLKNKENKKSLKNS